AARALGGAWGGDEGEEGGEGGEGKASDDFLAFYTLFVAALGSLVAAAANLPSLRFSHAHSHALGLRSGQTLGAPGLPTGLRLALVTDALLPWVCVALGIRWGVFEGAGAGMVPWGGMRDGA
ncbi:unnamed protein product, partial [Discosporangium mesarthrocarpum]